MPRKVGAGSQALKLVDLALSKTAGAQVLGKDKAYAGVAEANRFALPGVCERCARRHFQWKKGLARFDVRESRGD